MESWVEITQNKLGYSPTANLPANNCEFLVRGTYGSYFSRAGDTKDSVTFYFSINRPALVNAQGGKIRCLGGYVDGRPVYSADDELTITFKESHSGGHFTPIKVGEFAFFLDVERSNGSIDRLWLTRGGKNFLLHDIDEHKITISSGGPSSRYYVAETSPLFHQKRACKN